MTRRTFLAAACSAAAAGAPARSSMGLSPDCFGISRGPRTAYEYLEYAHERGAGGVQATLPSLEPDYLKKVRARAEEWNMYLEVTTPLPGPDTTAFERTLAAAKEAGAVAIRSVCLGGRRYETFATLDDWKSFVSDARARLGRAARIASKLRIPLGVENHKDWTVAEMVPLMREFGSEYVGACIDWGNNMALLDDPVETAEALAPFAVNSHIKDMAVEESAEGFLLAEVPLGDGILPLRRILDVIRTARPRTRYSLDMLTRNPLSIPCLTDKYWATFPDRNGRYLARALAFVRAHKPSRPLARVDALETSARMRLEQENVARSIAYARDNLGLR